jgi:excisionase family DNA binding protein
MSRSLSLGTAEAPRIRCAGDLLTAEEVASLLRVTPAWVYAQTRRRQIPHLRLGRYVRYRRDALEDWIERVENASSAPRADR